MIEQAGPDVLLRVKAVAGASRDEMAGILGDRVKVRVRAPAEGGKANKAICAVIAAALGVKPKQVSVEVGGGGPDKTIRVTGCTAAGVRSRLSR